MRLRYLLLALLPLRLPAQAVRDSVITVTATRTARVAPDRATLYLIIEGTAETATDAVARVETKLKVVTDALKTLGSRITVEPAMAYGVGPTPSPNGFPSTAMPATNLARSVLRVQVTRPDQVANIVATAIGAGAAGSSSLTFESSVADSVRRARIGEALGVARADAEAIAASLGARIGALVGVTTGTQNFGFQQPTMLTFDNRYFGQQAPAPDVVVATTITAQFRLVR